MAGKALRKQLFAEIERRGGAEWLADFIAGGGTVLDLATEMGCSRTYLSRHLNAHEEYANALRQGRREQADALADEALQIADGMADDPNITRERVAVAKERIDVRKWLAAVNDPDKYRQNNSAPSVTININQLHLDALKKRRDGGITIDGSATPIAQEEEE